MGNKIRNILFDLDGTITDPKEGIVNSILYALDKLEIQEKNIYDLDEFIGPPLRNSFITRYKLSDKLADKAMFFYREYFSKKGLFENKLYPEIEGLLKSLHNKKIRLFVATSKPTVYAKKIINHFKLDKYFTGIIGSNLDNTRTDKTEIIAHAITKYRLQINESIMIGDRKHDIVGAKNNSMRSVGVSYGYGSLKEISLYQPEFIAKDCAELNSILIN